jgi:tRNA(Arg) A34 adenosine deaminase TadA
LSTENSKFKKRPHSSNIRRKINLEDRYFFDIKDYDELYKDYLPSNRFPLKTSSKVSNTSYNKINELMKERYFKFARKASYLASYTGTRSSPAIGAVAIYKGSIAATASNTNKTSPLQAQYNVYRFKDVNTPPKVHAEVALVQKLRWKFGDSIDWSKVNIYLYREYKDGTLAPSRPCPSCMALLVNLGVKRICYTTENGYAEEKFK